MQKRLEDVEAQLASRGPYATAHASVVGSDPVVVLNYTQPNTGNITSIVSTAPPAPEPTAFSPPRGSESTLKLLHGSARSLASQAGSQDPSDLSSVEGDLRMQQGSSHPSLKGSSTGEGAGDAEAPSPGFAWLGNPEFSTGSAGVGAPVCTWIIEPLGRLSRSLPEAACVAYR